LEAAEGEDLGLVTDLPMDLLMDLHIMAVLGVAHAGVRGVVVASVEDLILRFLPRTSGTSSPKIRTTKRTPTMRTTLQTLTSSIPKLRLLSMSPSLARRRRTSE